MSAFILLFGFLFCTSLFFGCSGSIEKNKLTSSKWNLETLNGAKVTLPDGQFVTLEIVSESGSVAGKAPCNSYSSTYNENGEQLKFNVITSTKMACDEMNLESEYYNTLGKITAYKISGDKLKLYSGSTLAAEYKKAN